MKKNYLENLLVNIQDSQLKQAFQEIDEFTSREKLMPYYIQYDRPQSQQHVYLFWVNTLDVILRSYHKQSQTTLQQLISWFSFGNFQPLGLKQVIEQLIQENKIIKQENEKTIEQIIKNQNIVINKQKFNNNITSIWDNFLEKFSFQYFISPKIDDSLRNDQKIIFTEYFLRNVKIFEALMKETFQRNKDQMKIFNLNDLKRANQNKELSLSNLELKVSIFDYYVKFQQIQKIENCKNLNENYYILLRDKNFDAPEIQKDITIFLLQREIDKIEKLQNNKQEQLEVIEQQLNEAIIKKQINAKKFSLFKQKKAIQDQIQGLQEKHLVLFNQMNAVENAISDNNIYEILQNANSVLNQYVVDANQVRDAIVQIKEVQKNNEEIFIEYRQVNEENEQDIVEEFQKYLDKQIEPEIKENVFVPLEPQIQKKIKINNKQQQIDSLEIKPNENKIEQILEDLL